jgi:hypothetical protein
MKTTSVRLDDLRSLFACPDVSVIEIVDALLQRCREHRLQFEWQGDRLRARSSGGVWSDIPLRKSVFRAILARLAVLCNERTPNAVSPYGGEGVLEIGDNALAIVRVSFTNTSAEQKLELSTEIGSANAPRSPNAPMNLKGPT